MTVDILGDNGLQKHVKPRQEATWFLSSAYNHKDNAKTCSQVSLSFLHKPVSAKRASETRQA
ncbi:MAG: hypothetical protein COA75_08535 [Cellvibrionales bacterium]|nr:MAG: hypothetical protein COA75_08535 [Cellvibrionales bacterium]